MIDISRDALARYQAGLWAGIAWLGLNGLAEPFRHAPAWPYSAAAMKSTIFDSDCICLTILPTSPLGSLVSESRTR